ncbi:hypothetical protein M972_11729 [Acetivibrio thermocellus AD2]|jgi:hypothetical protein|uniref:Uncharacterized protein n=1 Tax=Acetivibrio thermocellus AD2 TaxID=1138384 RepID=A0AB36TDS8_ACETH|nr:hypothetical protein Clo1313_0690 [Acetivibrio thermocellus DSM 1313]ALX07700.1 hypothetical protein AD2_00702 [Acetivibrio thermocellus AD2]ANV75442.1 hypothetical protein LQRI_0701 [Acetivibrio thermocellus DSM 2360]EIC05658.1 hypothetical protein YSBL_0027 [Acetivibrio thermocellus YS]CDG37618.1 hypothetical protein CTHBC1_3059 [Acetivibrio thermocellus BC1]SOD26736.1 hypothetical protein SAMN04515622_2857 [Acetivibrio thermocellus]
MNAKVLKKVEILMKTYGYKKRIPPFCIPQFRVKLWRYLEFDIAYIFNNTYTTEF